MVDSAMNLWRKVVVHLEVNSSDDALVEMQDDTVNSNCGSLLLVDTDYFSCGPVKDLVRFVDLLQMLVASL